MINKGAVFCTFLASTLLCGCASDPASFGDPFEQTNRSVFAFNQKIDRNITRPVAVLYNHAVPQFARDNLHNVLSNLDSPVTLANDVLQADVARASQTAGRIAINSTLGLGGLVDLASRMGIPAHETDFGETLGSYGVGGGPYLVLPLLGPSNPRDFAGSVVDVFFDPLIYGKWRGATGLRTGHESGDILDLRARNIDTVEELQQSSIDFYAAVRSAYRQHRESEINHGQSYQNLPDY